MKNRSLIFQDQVKLIQPKLYSDAQNLVEDIFSAGGGNNRVALRTQIRATHSGYLLNQRVYPGVFVERSAPSWVSKERGGTASYDKPVILNHDQTDATQTIGRVRNVAFTRLKEGNEFRFDFKQPAQGTDHGSGHIMLDALISDPDAIQRIIDRRYDTVSTGQRPKEARCNICGFDWVGYDPWAEDSECCDHRPGRTYQLDDRDIPCFLITGDLEYRECSYVTVPAQPNARTLQANLESLQTFASKDSEGRELVFRSFDKAPVSKIALLDTEGHNLDLFLKDGEDDVIPDIATRFTKTAVFFPETKDEKMPKKLTTDEADKVLDSWISDAEKRAAETSTDKKKDDTVTDTETKTEEDVVAKATETEDSQTQEVEVITDSQASTKNVSDEALAEIIDTVRGERDALKTEKADLESKVNEQKGLVDTLTTQISDLRSAQVTDAARTLAVIRMITKQKTANDADSFDEIVEELSNRSIDSLRDAIADSLPALNDSLKGISRKTAPVPKVEDPTLQRDETKDQGDSDATNELMDKGDYLSQF